MRVQSLLVSLLLVVAASLPSSALAQHRRTGSHFGLGLATAVLNLGYGPVKVIYAAAGSAIGGLAWVFTGGNGEVSRPIIQTSVRGDYAIVPENLTGEKPLEFAGRDPERYPPVR